MVNQYGNDGICRQFSAYTCGPAAAVTALERLGLAASEGELAILARTSPLSGTDESALARALSRRYASAGLVASLARVGDLEGLAEVDGAIVAIRFGTWVDHYVAVLAVTPDAVIVGDPLAGEATYTRAAFLETCRPVAVTLRLGSIAGVR